MSFPIPESALKQHIGVLGKTGSGKSSTAKLIIEHVVAEGARVCVLDPIKSDWWGLTSSADGKKAGLPFYVLGGPHGHVPLHSSAGGALGELVARGELPLSIIDMADFEPGGIQKFFNGFAPTLVKRMRGVLYLVVEEAHEFAPKERAGFSNENLSIHYAKKLATAGRSKGIRLLVLTQRVQALHNAVLGSMDTVIAHRLTAPADQEPVLKWLKGNTPKDVRDNVGRSLASLPTGTGWICSGEAQIFERVAFPRISTFDNTATPDDDEAGDRQVKVATVDVGKLRGVIGDAIAEAEANDVDKLKARIRELERKLTAVPQADAERASIDARQVQLIRDESYRNGRADGYGAGRGQALEHIKMLKSYCLQHVENVFDIPLPIQSQAPADTPPTVPPKLHYEAQWLDSPASGRVELVASPINGESSLTPVQQRILDALAELEAIGAKSPPRELLGFMAGYTNMRSKSFSNAMGSMRSAGLIEYRGESVVLTDQGRKLARPQRRPTLRELHQKIIGMVGGPAAKILEMLIESHPQAVHRGRLASFAGYENQRSKSFSNAMGRLRTLGFIDYEGAAMVAAQPVLFMQ